MLSKGPQWCQYSYPFNELFIHAFKQCEVHQCYFFISLSIIVHFYEAFNNMFTSALCQNKQNFVTRLPKLAPLGAPCGAHAGGFTCNWVNNVPSQK
jgi:hypothetical protein